MPSMTIAKRLSISLLSCGLFWQSLPAAEQSRVRGRSGLEDLSNEMSTCAAYFSLLASIIENSAGAESNAATAKRMKLTGQAMLTQAVNIAKYIGANENLPMERIQVRLKEMVETINNDPPNSLETMHTKYGQPCDELLIRAQQRFVDLLQEYGD